MTRQYVSVESDTVQGLAAQASARGRTLDSLTNEILDVVVRIYGLGGHAEEILPAWKAHRLSRDVGGAALLPRTLVGRVAARIYAVDPEWILQQSFEAGREVGLHLRSFFPVIEDLHAEGAEIIPFLAERPLEVHRVRDGEERLGKIEVRATMRDGPELAACSERIIAGLLSAYSFRVTESAVDNQSIEVTAVYDPLSAPPVFAENGERKDEASSASP